MVDCELIIDQLKYFIQTKSKWFNWNRGKIVILVFIWSKNFNFSDLKRKYFFFNFWPVTENWASSIDCHWPSSDREMTRQRPTAYLWVLHLHVTLVVRSGCINFDAREVLRSISMEFFFSGFSSMTTKPKFRLIF